MTVRFISLLAIVSIATTGCSTLQGTSAPEPAAEDRNVGAQRATSALNIDLSVPLSPDQLAAIAVLTNPDLIALRAREGVADAQVFAAGLYPDPSFSFSADQPRNAVGLTTALAGSLGIDLATLVQRPYRQELARQNRTQVRLDIAWSEWLTGEQTRLLAVRVARLRDIRVHTQLLRDMSQNSLESVLNAAGRGDMSASGLEAYRLAAADAADRDRNVEMRLSTAESDLNRGLGLAPQERLQLDAGAQRDASISDADGLFVSALETRADLVAMQAGIDLQNDALELSQLARYPYPAISFNAARDTGNVRTLGPTVSFSLPLWNRGRGETAIARATLAQLQAEYAARIENLRADIYAAHTTLMIAREQRRDVERMLAPLFPQAAAAEVAAARGDLSIASATATRMTVLDRQIVESELALAVEELEISLEMLTGRRLEGE